ncbi:MAG: M14 family metallopeptidase [Caldilineaceae bacterium]
MNVFSVQITAASLEALRALDKFDVDLQRQAAKKIAGRYVVPGLLTEEQIKLVEAAGYTVEVVADLTPLAAERKAEVAGVNRFVDERALGDLAERTIGGYMTAEEVESALVNLKKLYPSMVTVIPLPEQTWEKRRSSAVHVQAGTTPRRVGVLFTGSMHAREWGGADACIAFLAGLLNAYAGHTGFTLGAKKFTAAQVQSILETVDLFVFPDVNPDGKVYSQTKDVWWRKNRNPNKGLTPASVGVDLNRNFDLLWNSGIGTSSSTANEIYRGVVPFSEPEARNVRYLFDTYPNIRYYVDIHSYSGLILYPWGDDNNQTTDPKQNFHNPAYDGKRGVVGSGYAEFIPAAEQKTLVELAKRMNKSLKAVRGTAYSVQQSVGLYPTSGTVDDWVFSRHFLVPAKPIVYSFTIEFGAEFIPPYAEMRNIIKELNAAMTELCLAAARAEVAHEHELAVVA